MDGRLASIVHIRDVSGNTTYNSSGAVTGGSTDDQYLSRFSYGYDDNGQLISRARLFYDASGSHLRTAWNEFTYDRLGRLVGESYQQNDAADQSKNRVRAFAYDLAGNRTAMQSNVGSATYSHNDLHQLSSDNGSSYAYDLTGNLTSSSGSVSRTLTWDVAGSLVQVSSGGNTIKYTYDDSGSGMLRSRQLNSGDITYYFWDGFSLYLERVATNAARTYFNHPWSLGSTICRFDLGGNNQVDSTDNAWFYLHDEAGNVIMVTDKAGQPVIEFEQDVWGNDLAGNFNDSPYITQHQTGKLWDQEAGLYYNAARWYDPVLGRFISVSPISPFAEEEYAFCGNDPVNFGDIDGLEGKWVWDWVYDRWKERFKYNPDAVSFPVTPSPTAEDVKRKMTQTEGGQVCAAGVDGWSPVGPVFDGHYNWNDPKVKAAFYTTAAVSMLYGGTLDDISKGGLKLLSKGRVKGFDAHKFKYDWVRDAGGSFDIAVDSKGRVSLIHKNGTVVPTTHTLDELQELYPPRSRN